MAKNNVITQSRTQTNARTHTHTHTYTHTNMGFKWHKREIQPWSQVLHGRKRKCLAWRSVTHIHHKHPHSVKHIHHKQIHSVKHNHNKHAHSVKHIHHKQTHSVKHNHHKHPHRVKHIRPPLWIKSKCLRAGPPEMPLWNWYNCGTNHFNLTSVVRWKWKNQLDWVIKPVPHDLVRRMRFWRIKNSGTWF